METSQLDMTEPQGQLKMVNSIRHTAADVFFRGYKIVIASDGVEAFSQKDHEEGLKYLKEVYNAEIKAVNEIIEEFEKE